MLRDWVLNKRQAMNCSYEPVLPMNDWTNKPDEPDELKQRLKIGAHCGYIGATLELDYSYTGETL